MPNQQVAIGEIHFTNLASVVGVLSAGRRAGFEYAALYHGTGGMSLLGSRGARIQGGDPGQVMLTFANLEWYVGLFHWCIAHGEKGGEREVARASASAVSFCFLVGLFFPLTSLCDVR